MKRFCFLFQLAEMVNLHFLSLIEALQEINSIVLANVGSTQSSFVPIKYFFA